MHIITSRFINKFTVQKKRHTPSAACHQQPTDPTGAVSEILVDKLSATTLMHDFSSRTTVSETGQHGRHAAGSKQLSSESGGNNQPFALGFVDSTFRYKIKTGLVKTQKIFPNVV